MTVHTDVEAIGVQDLVMAFGSFRALKGVSLSVHPGEVVGLLGENGAGKSTLIKVLAGIYRPTSGTVRLAGKEVTLGSPREAISAGVATVHQHSMLAGNLTVAANLILGDEPRRAGIVTTQAINNRARAILDQVGIDLPLNTRVEDLSLAERQRVEIVRAASQATAVMILDEPTAALEQSEVAELFDTIRHLRDRGIAVLYISHRLDEIPQICDRVVVLRDGSNVGELDGEHCVPAEIIPLLAGRPLDELFPTLSTPGTETVLEVDGLSTATTKPFAATLHRGEVLGLTGAAGAGQREVARAIAGIERARGAVFLDGQPVRNGSVPDAIHAGITYISGDRAEGAFPDLSVWRNAAVGFWPHLSQRLGFLNSRAERRTGTRLADEYRVRGHSFSQPISTLSGGNQQKVLIARWAGTSPRVIVLDEPTLGVDVGARREIYDLIAEKVAEGTSIVLVSSDHAELQAMSHRVVVFANGAPVAEMDAVDASEEAVLAARIPVPVPGKDTP